MPYDPFAPADHPRGARERKLTRKRWPSIFDSELRSLEWKSDARKRPRTESDATGGESARASAIKSESNVDSQAEHRSDSAPSSHAEPTTIMGTPALADDRVRSVVNFMLQNVNAPNIEVEAKLGLLIEKIQECRAVDLVPVTCETPLAPRSNADTRFASEVGAYVFQHLNETLNARYVATVNAPPNARVRYVRTKELDVYWPGRIRETRVLSGNEVYKTVRVMNKTRLSDLNVLCPGSSLDVRYSASREATCELPQSGAPQSQRSKDRISYRFEHISVDITAATRSNETSQPVTTHEVEVEVADAAALYAETVKYREGDASSKVFEIAASLVNTVRHLLEEVYKAEEKWRKSNGT